VANPAFTDSTELLDHCVALSEWRREVSDSPTPLVALARAHVDWAWEARGSGLASQVPAEGWRPFFTRLAEGRGLLEEAMEIGVKDGEAYRLMILVAMGENWPVKQTRATLEEGQQVDPTYFPMYVQFARYLLPRWHGKRGDTERFAAEMTEALPRDDGLEAFARIAAGIHQIDAERELLFLGAYDRNLLVRASEVVRQRREGDRDAANFAALSAWVAQDREAAKRLRPLIGDEMEDDRIWPWQQQRREFIFWCNQKDWGATNETRWFWGSLFHGANVVFAADSRSIWCGGGYGPFALNRLEIESGTVVQSLRAPGPGVDCFAVNEERRWVVAALTGTFFKGLALWDLDNPDKPARFPMDERCSAIAISPDARQVAYRTGRTIRIFDTSSQERIASIDGPANVRRLRFSADGKWLAVSDLYESVWDVETGKLVHEMPRIEMQPRPDILCRRILDIDEEGRMWALIEQIKPAKQQKAMLVRYAPDAKTYEPIIPDLHYPLAIPHNAVLSADRSLLAINSIPEGKRMPPLGIEVWDVKSGRRIKQFDGHHSGFHAMTFSPDGKWLASMGFPTGLVRLWSIADDESLE
jgi:hypothetical protein